jgi:SAM-dependent methyltransferase
MPSRAYHESLWESVPEGLAPAAVGLREGFLLGCLAGERGRLGRTPRVLDVGCGEGQLTAEIARAGCRVIGVDVAEEPLRRGRELHPGIDLRRVELDGEWPLPDAGFDVVWAGETIEHVADTARWLSQLRRLLRSGGSLLLSTPANGRLELLSLALSRRRMQERFEPRSDHLRFYSAGSLAALLADFGFERISVRGAGGPPGARRVLLAAAVRSRF